ncbi:MAG: hypothetical protein IKX91_04470, partial [Firmicutes bacterium]|nr:hypothetical protein [Bacillota bacterium]
GFIQARVDDEHDFVLVHGYFTSLGSIGHPLGRGGRVFFHAQAKGALIHYTGAPCGLQAVFCSF